MADAYLLETGATDRYLLEDGSGVLLIDLTVPTVEQDHFRIRTQAGTAASVGVNVAFA